MKLSCGMLAAACIAMLTTTGYAHKPASGYISAYLVMPGCRALIANLEPDNYQKGLCLGTVYGLGVGLRILQDLREAGEKMPWGCVPQEVTVGQQIRVITAYIDARPNRLHEDFRELAWEALKDTWPCKG